MSSVRRTAQRIGREPAFRSVAGALAFAPALLLLTACSSAPTDTEAPFSLSAGVLPFPAVVTGDSLRNADGTAVQLQAIAYNGKGDPIPGAPIEYFSTDTAVTVENGFLSARGAPGRTVATFARIGNLTLEISPSAPLRVVRAPATITTSGDVPDSVSYAAPSVRSEPISVVLRSEPDEGATEGAAVPGWIVEYEVEFRGARLAPDDLNFRLVEPGGSGAVPAPQDTTDNGGIAAREVVVLNTGDIAQGETLVVIITTRHLGANVAGSPIEIPLRLTAAP
ncbi:MAG TPA: hypothetical protein VKZ41_04775 [Gemmatimonadales bacterium]|nr:hypothetical protein [Gemmatimonadales bacterium]